IFTPTSVVFMILALGYAISPIRAYTWCQTVSIPRMVTAMVLFAIATLSLFTQSYNPFLYFQF
ncbi:MAG: MBOAT family protein, partial [Fibrobacteraceae bacterium]